ncbi:MAG: CopD family protein [Cellvibrionaceae bacterium]
MSIDLWDLLTLVSRVAIYFGVAGTLGGAFSLLVLPRSRTTDSLWHYLRWSCLVGLLGTAGHFFVRVASLGAPFDETLVSIVAQSAVGDASKMQVGGFALILVASFTARRAVAGKRWLGIAGLGLGSVSLLLSFSLAGHLAEQKFLTRLTLALHVLAMALWLGALYPLLHLMRSEGPAQAQPTMKRFGRLAVGIVGLLVACGIWLGLVLIPDFGSLLSTGHGRTLGIKLFLVGLLLLLAAGNKWFWVPRLPESKASSGLSISIRGELALGILILIATAVLANLVGPHH